MVNFGIVYGITASGLARRLGPGYTVARAKEIIESYRACFRGSDAFPTGSVDAAQRPGHAPTHTGPQGRLPGRVRPHYKFQFPEKAHGCV